MTQELKRVEKLPAKRVVTIPGGSGGKRYEICCVDALDDRREMELRGSGYAFLDRVLVYEIRLKRFSGPEPGLPNGITVRCDRDFTEELYELAQSVFLTDRRFHLQPLFDANAAVPVLRAYIDDCREKEMKLFKAYHGETLLGFTVVDERADGDGKYFENVLGAAKADLRGKLAAPALYEYMLRTQQERFTCYLGRVSSSNAASINLHSHLGGKVVRIYDQFII